jgi:hypothetical protein
MKTLILCAFFLQNLLFSGPQALPAPAEAGPFIHSVYFWLHDDVPENERLQFRETLESLERIRGIRKIYVLEPAGVQREVVDNSYDFALIIHFRDMAAQDAYQVDPLHVRAVQKMQPLIKKIVVYDAE